MTEQVCEGGLSLPAVAVAAIMSTTAFGSTDSEKLVRLTDAGVLRTAHVP